MALVMKIFSFVFFCYIEFRRAPSLHRIFPTRDRVPKIMDLFTVQRYNNVLLWKFLELSDEQQRELLSKPS